MKIRTQLIAGFSILTLLVIIMQIMAFREFSQVTQANAWVNHTHGVVEDAQRIEKMVLDMETGLRGFLLTGNEVFLTPYTQAHSQYGVAIKALQNRVADNPTQVKRLAEIQDQINNWYETVSKPRIEILQKEIKRQVSADSALDELADELHRTDLSLEGKRRVDQIRESMNAFIAIENSLLLDRQRESETQQRHNRIAIIGGALGFLVFGITGMILLLRSILFRVGGEPAEIEALTTRIGEGNFDVDTSSMRLTGIMAAVIRMKDALKQNREILDEKNWLNENSADLADILRGSKETTKLSHDVIGFIAGKLNIQVGTLSLADEDQTQLTLTGSYAYKSKPDAPTQFQFGEGLTGQAAKEKKPLFIQDIPEDYLTVVSALGEMPPTSISCLPLVYEGKVEGVIELGSMGELNDLQRTFLIQSAERIAIAIHTARAREKMKILLEESQTQAEELQAQTEELETQQEELRVTNEELEEKASELATQSKEKAQDQES